MATTHAIPPKIYSKITNILSTMLRSKSIVCKFSFTLLDGKSINSRDVLIFQSLEREKRLEMVPLKGVLLDDAGYTRTPNVHHKVLGSQSR